MHDFFEKHDNSGSFFFFFLKMNEAWLNAPSLGHESMVLENLDLINFSFFSFFNSCDAIDDFF